MTIKTRVPAEDALLALLDRDLPQATEGARPRVGGNAPDDVDIYYVRLTTLPGGGSDRLNIETVIDVDCFAPSYATARSCAFAVEAVVLGYPHVVEVGDRKVVLDSVEQNTGPAELPWEDDSAYRIGATYVITTRRP